MRQANQPWTSVHLRRRHPGHDSLLLTHAFAELECIAVEFRTHRMNHQSRAAILRLGAKQDGVLRSHMVMADGSLRDTVVFSITQAEWPGVRNELRRRMAVHS